MLTKENILKITKEKTRIITNDIVSVFNVSRQYASSMISALVKDNKLQRIGFTRNAFYVLPEYAIKHPEIIPNRYVKNIINKNVEEHRIVNDIEQTFPILKKLPENVRSIFAYAFSEMLNNAVEHSRSKNIKMEVTIKNKLLSFIIEDYGVGVFRNVMHKRKLKSELEAMQDILKGKTTTMPKSHSGEGIFFTSKVGDIFILDSFGHQLIINNELPDVFVKRTKGFKQGTRVSFQVKTSVKLHLNDVFNEFTDIQKNDSGFNRTEIRVKLFTIGGIHISRSQARRVLAGLDSFKIIVFDFDKVQVIGQAFADEIFRVFQAKHKDIKLETENMEEGVKFMVNRAKSEANTL